MTCVVVGGGVAGLVVARDLALPGEDVVLLEADRRPGGSVAAHEVAGLRLDAGAESFATRTTAVADLLAELGLGDDVVLPDPAGAWLHRGGRSVPLPRTGVLGIPAAPWSADVRRAVGPLAAARGALDAVLPARAGTGPGVTSLGALVRARMGRGVTERLVAPVVRGVHSADPDDLDVTVLPGLREAVRERGSLGAAVAAVRSAAPAGSAVAGLRGGMHRMVDALVAEITAARGQVRTGVPVEWLDRDGEGWVLGTPDGAVTADLVVLATPGTVTAGLLERVLPGSLPPGPAQQRVVLATLVVDAPALDAAPRGTGVLVADHGHRAKALTHATAKWAWLAELAGPGRHVLRLSYGTAVGDPAVPDADLRTRALQDATTLLGVPLDEDVLVGWARTSWSSGLPPLGPGHRTAVERTRAALAAHPGLAVCGAWAAGTGLAAVVADARRTAATIAHP